MEHAFPFPVKMKSSVPTINGMRFSPFQNVDGEMFAKPALNGYWRVDMTVVAHNMQAQLALSSFTTAMAAAGAECVVPICTQWRPNDSNGRPLTGCDMAPEYTFDHVGFLGDPFPGFRLASDALPLNSYLDIERPELSQLWPGHFISLRSRLYQVINVSAIDDRPDRIRVSVLPNIRGYHPAGEIVIVDQLRLRCRMESGDQIGLSTDPLKIASLNFIEAF